MAAAILHRLSLLFQAAAKCSGSLLDGILDDIPLFCHWLTGGCRRGRFLLTFHTRILTFIPLLRVVIRARPPLPLRLVGSDSLIFTAPPLIVLVRAVISSAPTIIALVRAVIHGHLQSNNRLVRANLLIIAVPTLPLPAPGLQPVHTCCQLTELLLQLFILPPRQCRWWHWLGSRCWRRSNVSNRSH